MYAELIMEDIGWLDVVRIHGEEAVIQQRSGLDALGTVGQKRRRSAYEGDGIGDPDDLNIEGGGGIK